MKVPEAIEILEHIVTYRDCYDNTENDRAIKLGIEALKWVKRYRPDNKVDRWSPLPGETED